MELSKRLKAVADLVTPGMSLADIGCDHGYISIYLTENGICPHVIAMDINEGPLEKAREHIAKQPTQLPIDLRLSDGLKAVKPGEVQSIIIAGMGGGLVMKILSDCPEVVSELQECILQPQSEIYKVRAFLLQEGFCIIAEDMILEDGKYYPMMKVLPPKKVKTLSDMKSKWTEAQLHFGKYLMAEKNPILMQFLQKEKQQKRQVLESLKEKKGEHIATRIDELTDELKLIEEALQ